jgi:hypothetical protein
MCVCFVMFLQIVFIDLWRFWCDVDGSRFENERWFYCRYVCMCLLVVLCFRKVILLQFVGLVVYLLYNHLSHNPSVLSCSCMFFDGGKISQVKLKHGMKSIHVAKDLLCCNYSWSVKAILVYAQHWTWSAPPPPASSDDILGTGYITNAVVKWH